MIIGKRQREDAEEAIEQEYDGMKRRKYNHQPEEEQEMDKRCSS
jgi:hypothetical protein